VLAADLAKKRFSLKESKNEQADRVGKQPGQRGLVILNIPAQGGRANVD
jgi:hypothetical protein